VVGVESLVKDRIIAAQNLDDNRSHLADESSFLAANKQ
jgi:hypothetical protein